MIDSHSWIKFTSNLNKNSWTKKLTSNLKIHCLYMFLFAVNNWMLNHWMMNGHWTDCYLLFTSPQSLKITRFFSIQRKITINVSRGLLNPNLVFYQLNTQWGDDHFLLHIPTIIKKSLTFHPHCKWTLISKQSQTTFNPKTSIRYLTMNNYLFFAYVLTRMKTIT